MTRLLSLAALGLALSTMQPVAGSNTATSLSDDAQKFLGFHNTFRATHGAKELVWNADMAAKAQGWVNQCKHGHSDPFLGYGENGAEGAGGGYNITTAMDGWAGERDKYSIDNPGNAVHFTQMVWKATTDLGCAVASCDKLYPPEYGVASVVICEYYPAGNMGGQYAENVQP